MSENATKEDIADLKRSIEKIFSYLDEIKDNMANYKEKVAENYINQADCDKCSKGKDDNIKGNNNKIWGLYATFATTIIGMLYWVSAKFDKVQDQIGQLIQLGHK